MKIIIRADEGDELTVNAHHLSVDCGFVRVQIQNRAHEGGESDWITLPADKARELGCALIAASAKLIVCGDEQASGRPEFWYSDINPV